MQAMGMRHAAARFFFWIALIVGIAGIGMSFAGVRVLPSAALIGVPLAALGLSILLGGEMVAGGAPRTYAVRGQVVRGDLVARTGPADLAVGAGGIDRVASMRHGPLGKPKFTVEDGVANLRMSNPIIPNIAAWEAKLAGNVLWDIDARSGLGTLSLDLTNLRIERVVAHSSMGRVEIKCPSRGFAQLFLSAGLGEIDLTIPEHVGARVMITRGALSDVEILNERLQALDAKRYATPDFETASAQVEIKIEPGSGDVIIR
jgi:hypothetical protein